MIRSRAAEREQVGTGLRYAEGFDPELDAGHAVVPALAHERQPVGRIAHDAINALGVERLHHLAAVAVIDVPGHEPERSGHVN